MTHVPRDCANNQWRRKYCRCRLTQYPRVRGLFRPLGQGANGVAMGRCLRAATPPSDPLPRRRLAKRLRRGYGVLRTSRRLAQHRRVCASARRPSSRSPSPWSCRACIARRTAQAVASLIIAGLRPVSSVRAPVREAPAEATGRCAQAIASLTAARVASAIYVDASGRKAYEACLRDAARMCV
ncbi:hypothetical protein K438DRAFT_1983239 [Mycena galopus ATCC 62051]|nr:hypothetical protein K438DRAFT_1983239 [Mycena galopus ATCC 62051]